MFYAFVHQACNQAGGALSLQIPNKASFGNKSMPGLPSWIQTDKYLSRTKLTKRRHSRKDQVITGNRLKLTWYK